MVCFQLGLKQRTGLPKSTKDPAVQRQKLAADMAQFDATMVALVHGDGEMLPPNEPARKAGTAWNSHDMKFRMVHDGPIPDF